MIGGAPGMGPPPMMGGFPPHGGRRPGPGGSHGGPPREYVRVTPDGEVLGVFKRALRPMGVRLTAQTENFAEDWSVEDGTNFSRFQDGMVLRPMGSLTKARAAKLLRAYDHASADDFEARVGIPLGGVAGHSGRGRGRG